MNERIQELAGKAGAKCHTDPKFTEKFAKLIIKECMYINNQFVGRRIGEIDLDVVYKEHFGVK